MIWQVQRTLLVARLCHCKTLCKGPLQQCEDALRKHWGMEQVLLPESWVAGRTWSA